jgi:hypothetical protein
MLDRILGFDGCALTDIRQREGEESGSGALRACRRRAERAAAGMAAPASKTARNMVPDAPWPEPAFSPKRLACRPRNRME